MKTHIFTPQEDDKDFCQICNKNFRNEIHTRLTEKETEDYFKLLNGQKP